MTKYFVKTIRVACVVGVVLVSMWFGLTAMASWAGYHFLVLPKVLQKYEHLGVYALGKHAELRVNGVSFSELISETWPLDGKTCLVGNFPIILEPTCKTFQFPTAETVATSKGGSLYCGSVRSGSVRDVPGMHWSAAVDTFASAPEFLLGRLDADQISTVTALNELEEKTPQSKWLECAFEYFPPRLIKRTQCEGFSLFIYDVPSVELPEKCAGLPVALE